MESRLFEHYSKRKERIPQYELSNSKHYRISCSSGDGCTIIFNKDTEYFGRELVLPGRHIGDHQYHVELTRMAWYYPDHDELIDDLTRLRLISLIKEGEKDNGAVFSFLESIEDKKEMSIYYSTCKIFDNDAPIHVELHWYSGTIFFSKYTEFPRLRLDMGRQETCIYPLGWVNYPRSFSIEEEYRALAIIDNGLERNKYNLEWWL